MVDDPIGNSWGYIDGLKLASAESIIGKLIDTVSKGGFYLFNISPTAEGVIPEDQQAVLLKIGAWLEVNGEAIYGTRPWSRFADGGFHFTSKGNAVYALATKWPDGEAVISGVGKVRSVTLLGAGELAFKQEGDGVRVKMPGEHGAAAAWVIRMKTY